MRKRLLLLVVAAVTLASSLQAQALPDTSARIRGAAISDFNGRPIAGVMISAPEVKKFVVTDSDGQFALAGLPAGKRSIRVSYEGRETQDYVFTLQGQETKQIAVVLDVDAEDLNPLVVEARQADLWRLRALLHARGDHEDAAQAVERAPHARGHRDALLSGLSPDAIHPRQAVHGPGERRWRGVARDGLRSDRGVGRRRCRSLPWR